MLPVLTTSTIRAPASPHYPEGQISPCDHQHRQEGLTNSGKSGASYRSGPEQCMYDVLWKYVTRTL